MVVSLEGFAEIAAGSKAGFQGNFQYAFAGVAQKLLGFLQPGNLHEIPGGDP